MSDFVPQPGALKYQDESGEWHYANPQDILYSTVTMAATHFWKEEKQRWCLIWDKPCCENEKRNMNGGCDNCGDPCL